MVDCCGQREQLNSANVALMFGMLCAAGTMQSYPVGKGVIPLLGLNRVDPLQLLLHDGATNFSIHMAPAMTDD